MSNGVLKFHTDVAEFFTRRVAECKAKGRNNLLEYYERQVTLHRKFAAELAAPIPMILHCPACGLQHIDAPEVGAADECPASGQQCTIVDDYGPNGESGCKYCGSAPRWDNPPHRSHLCHQCGHIWRPADVATTGVETINTKGKADKPHPICTSWGVPIYDEDVNGGRK